MTPVTPSRTLAPVRRRWAGLVVTTGALSIGLVGCGGDDPDAHLYAYGHSWVTGRAPDPSVEPWPERVAAELGIPGENRGIPAAESPAIADRVLAEEPACADVVVLEPVLNDVRHWGTDDAARERFRATLRRMLDHVETAQVVVVVDPPIPGWALVPPYDQGSDEALDRYRRVVDEEVTDETVVDLAEDWTPDLMAPDGIHPNEAGTAHVAEEVVAAIRPLSPSC